GFKIDFYHLSELLLGYLEHVPYALAQIIVLAFDRDRSDRAVLDLHADAQDLDRVEEEFQQDIVGNLFVEIAGFGPFELEHFEIDGRTDQPPLLAFDMIHDGLEARIDGQVGGARLLLPPAAASHHSAAAHHAAAPAAGTHHAATAAAGAHHA